MSPQSMINNELIKISLIATSALTLFFAFFPGFDIEISSYFYELDRRFIHKHNAINQFFFRSVPILTNLFITGCLAYILFLLAKYKDAKLLLKFFLYYSSTILLISYGKK